MYLLSRDFPTGAGMLHARRFWVDLSVVCTIVALITAIRIRLSRRKARAIVG